MRYSILQHWWAMEHAVQQFTALVSHGTCGIALYSTSEPRNMRHSNLQHWWVMEHAV